MATSSPADEPRRPPGKSNLADEHIRAAVESPNSHVWVASADAAAGDGRVVRVIPDLDDQLTAALSWIEELLVAYGVGDGPDHPVDVAYAAFSRLWDAVAPTQGEHSPAGRLLAPDGRYEHAPVRVIGVDSADVAALRAVAETLTGSAIDHGEEEIVDLAAIAADHFPDKRDRAGRVAAVFGLLDLLDAAPDADALLLADLVSAWDGVEVDLVLTADQEAAYRRWTVVVNDLFAGGDPLSEYTY